ncbi:MAG: hypothetical protein MZU91_04790, partial [Desulfosudis oleivorans]|nr:hypothetical protein [Desulfosudis oleivorans]
WKEILSAHLRVPAPRRQPCRPGAACSSSASPWPRRRLETAARACGGPVEQAWCPRISVSTPRGQRARTAEDLGFTKLVRRDDGVCENVTARSGDSRYMLRGRLARPCRTSRKTITD